MVCQSWALQGYGTPTPIYVVYLLKIALYVWIWSVFCGFTPGLGDLGSFSTWYYEPIAFQKAVLWSMAFEGLGLGCGSGPLTGRYNPPFGGPLYFLQARHDRRCLSSRVFRSSVARSAPCSTSRCTRPTCSSCFAHWSRRSSRSVSSFRLSFCFHSSPSPTRPSFSRREQSTTTPLWSASCSWAIGWPARRWSGSPFGCGPQPRSSTTTSRPWSR